MACTDVENNGIGTTLMVLVTINLSKQCNDATELKRKSGKVKQSLNRKERRKSVP